MTFLKNNLTDYRTVYLSGQTAQIRRLICSFTVGISPKVHCPLISQWDAILQIIGQCTSQVRLLRYAGWFVALLSAYLRRSILACRVKMSSVWPISSNRIRREHAAWNPMKRNISITLYSTCICVYWRGRSRVSRMHCVTFSWRFRDLNCVYFQ